MTINNRKVQTSIQWFHGYANDPKLRIIDPSWRYPSVDAPIWIRDDAGHVWYDDGTYVAYLFMGNGVRENTPAQLRGFGGAHITRRLVDGSVIETNDGWSSRCSKLPVPCTEVLVNNSVVGLHLNLYKQVIADMGLHLVPDWEGKPIGISVEPGDAIVKPATA